MLLLMFRLLKPEFASKAVVPAVAASVAQAVPTPGEVPTATPVPDPVWEWTKIRSDSMVFAPGSGMTGYEVPRDSHTQVKVGIQAKSPVTVGYFPDSYAEAMKNNTANTLTLPIFACLNQHVLQTTVQCTLDTSVGGYLLFIKDERTGGQLLGAGVMRYLGDRKPLEDMSARNDVTVDLMNYVCTRNCTDYDKQR
jgi:hypothetical protein